MGWLKLKHACSTLGLFASEKSSFKLLVSKKIHTNNKSGAPKIPLPSILLTVLWLVGPKSCIYGEAGPSKTT